MKKAGKENFSTAGSRLHTNPGIALGCSQSDRCVLILLVEFSDFNPSESWPDPKYMGIWQQMRRMTPALPQVD
jgi:hypothetical protein